MGEFLIDRKECVQCFWFQSWTESCKPHNEAVSGGTTFLLSLKRRMARQGGSEFHENKYLDLRKEVINFISLGINAWERDPYIFQDL